MFDDLRKEASPDYESEQAQAKPAAQASVARAPQRSRKMLGMNGPQRFVISFMLMLMVCVIGFMFLLVMGRIGF